jgi:hypothetical protein
VRETSGPQIGHYTQPSVGTWASDRGYANFLEPRTGEVPRTPLLVEVQITISLPICKRSRAEVARSACRGGHDACGVDKDLVDALTVEWKLA